jgi:hypothetical protein
MSAAIVSRRLLMGPSPCEIANLIRYVSYFGLRDTTGVTALAKTYAEAVTSIICTAAVDQLIVLGVFHGA